MMKTVDPVVSIDPKLSAEILPDMKDADAA